MSACTPFLDRILEAEATELDGSADTPLSRHLAACEHCSAAARRILEGHRMLDEAMSSAPDIDVDAIVARARLEAVSTGAVVAEAAAAGAHPRIVSGPGRPLRRWMALGAAASIGALLLLSRREGPLPGVELAPREAAHATVEAADDQNVAVIQTDNPDITVLWFF